MHHPSIKLIPGLAYKHILNYLLVRRRHCQLYTSTFVNWYVPTMVLMVKLVFQTGCLNYVGTNQQVLWTGDMNCFIIQFCRSTITKMQAQPFGQKSRTRVCSRVNKNAPGVCYSAMLIEAYTKPFKIKLMSTFHKVDVNY